MRTCLGITGIFLAVILLVAVSASWIIVYVHDRDEGLRLVVPAPVFLADVGLAFAGVAADPVDLPPEAREVLPHLPKLVDELREAEDAELLRFEEPGTEITIRKEGDLLRISVNEGDDVVRIVAPLAALVNLADAVEDGHITIGELTGSLGDISRTRLVDVQDGNQDVRVWVW